jgi:hypothetical protein
VKKPKPEVVTVQLDGPCCPHGSSVPHEISAFMPNPHIKMADPKYGNWCVGPSK